MKSKQRSVLCLSVLSALTLTSCNSKIPADWDKNIVWEADGQTEYNKLKDVKRKAVYNYYESYMPSSLNSVKTFQSEDSRYITNIIDGLVDVDRQGNIIPDLAGDWTWNDDSSVLTLSIRQNVPWVYNRGDGSEIYKDANGNAAYVSADDWVSAARYNLDFSNQAETSYLLYMFINGAEEYYQYTLMQYKKSHGYGVITEAKVNENKDDENYEVCSKRVGTDAGPTSLCGKYIDPAAFTDDYIAAYLSGIGVSEEGLKASDLPSIANFSRVGVKSSNSGKTLTYELNGTHPYFLSVLTYTPYFPVYEPFVESIGGIDKYGTERDYVLANGAFVMKEFKMGTGTKIKFRRNENYWDINNVHLLEVNAIQIPSNFSEASARKAFEAKTIDGFSVNEKDSEGWKKYVEGPNGTGTVDNPYHEDAHTVDGTGDGSTYAFMLNLNRDADMTGSGVNKTLMSSESAFNVDADGDGKNDTVMNTNKALSLSPAFRELVLKSLDIRSYLHSEGNTPYEQNKQVVNTWVPANFINYSHTSEDEADGIFGNDFVDFTKKAYMDTYYGGDYSTENRAKAEAALGYGHVSTGENALTLADEETAPNSNVFKLTQDGQAELDALKAAAKKELTEAGVKMPVVVEYAGLTYSSTADRFDAEFVNSTNARVNGCWYGGNALEASVGRPSDALICTKTQEDDAIFRLVKNNSQNVPNPTDYSAISSNYAATIIISGWGPDYSDPLTFANCTVLDGDMSPALGTGSSNPYYSELQKQWAKYDQLVSDASALTESKARYAKFAESEIELLFNLNVLKPIKMRGLGKSVSVTKTVPFRITRANYGVSSYKYKYIEVLENPISKEVYNALRAEFQLGK